LIPGQRIVFFVFPSALIFIAQSTAIQQKLYSVFQIVVSKCCIFYYIFSNHCINQYLLFVIDYRTHMSIYTILSN